MEEKALANRIRAYRKLKALTQQELAERIGVSVAVLGSVERGTRKPKKDLLERIAKALKIQLNELIPPTID
jgi:transcriptional regulator with XRE-family HTH domain